MTSRLNLPAREIRKGLRISAFEGAFAQIHINLTGGIFLSGLALYLHATDFEISLLSAIPALCAPLAFLSGWLVYLTGSRKAVTTATSALARGLFFIPAFILLLKGSFNMRSLLVIIGAFNAMIVITGNTWTSWMSDLVPRNRLGRYFGIRNTVTGIVGMVISYAGAWFLDIFKAQERLAEGLGWIFLVASTASLVNAVLLVFQPYPRRQRQTFRMDESFLVPLRDRKFRKLLVFLAFWFTTSGVASPFYGVHMLENLKMPYSQAAIYGVAAGILSLLFQLVWGRVIDRIHPKPVLQINFFGISFLPLLWLFATPHFYLPIWVDSVITGIFWTGVNASLFTLMLGSITEQRLKESYIALYSTVVGVCSFVSAFLGGVIAESLAGFRLELFGFTFINYHILFLAASLARIAALPLLARVDDPGVPSVKITLAAMGDYASRRLSMGKELLQNAFMRRLTWKDANPDRPGKKSKKKP